MKNILLGLSLLSLVLSSCKQDDRTPLLLGKWRGASWTLNGKDSGRDYATIQFEFMSDNQYTSSFGSQSEKGSFKLKRDELYTTGENKIEKMVKLSKLNADTLVMDMNRAGEAEVLTLVKEH